MLIQFLVLKLNVISLYKAEWVVFSCRLSADRRRSILGLGGLHGTRRYFGGLHHAASHHWFHHLRPWHPLRGRVRGQGGCNLSTPEAADHHGGSSFVQTVLMPLKEDRDGHDQRWPLILAGRHRERTTA